MPPLRRDSFKDLDNRRSRSASRVSRSVSRVSSRDLSSRRPNPPPPAPKTPPLRPRVKAAPAFLRQATSTSNVVPPVKAPPVPPPRPARSPSADRPVAARTVGTSSKTPPWREREQRQYTARGRERSQTPVERNTRTRTESRSSAGASWTNTRRDRDRPVGVPEPPPPPTRMSGSQWLNQGYQEPQSSSSSYRPHGQYYQQPYYRANPRTHNVEHVPGYTVPHNRRIQKHDGDWLDLLPHTPDQSIYFNQPRAQRRANELWLYGYTFSMGL